ncbi:MAG: biopolymer transporter ExbD [Phycisphaerales bacterium]|nr:biopolymer transporter ExbD [Phycisphaerales bacterium]
MLIRPREGEAHLHIDFVPMVDVLFNILIFFLLATSFKQLEREMQIALPYAAASGPLSATLRELVINVTDGGDMIVNGQAVAEADLRGMVTSLVAGNPGQKVTVRGDRTTAYANVVKALDICKGAGIQEPYLDTVLGG